MEVLNGADDLRGIEQAWVVAESPTAAQVAEEFATRNVVHQHVEEVLVVVSPEAAGGQRTESSICGEDMTNNMEQHMLGGSNLLSKDLKYYFTSERSGWIKRWM